MDKGAHFQKCDFQVHSPRDLQWTGNTFGTEPDRLDLLTDEEKEDISNSRIQFAKEYLQKARDKGLNAIAITDHHDLAFAKVIRKVAIAENTEYISTGQSSKCITVFPGIELTLTTPTCQCIIIFDADLHDQHLDAALSMFGIVASNDFEKKTAPTLRISTEQIMDLKHLHKKFDDQAVLKGRYILLPNVNCKGTSTLLRAGAHDHYNKMPCVGGYVDGELSTDTGWLNKLNGGDVNYASKAIAVIRTSDNRFEDGRKFGDHFTWIKWAQPSAEALRQAFLARQSRVSQDEPLLPQVTLKKLDVTNSKFMGSFSIEFNAQYNALIGGRGTGKSTILEYLRWGVCDQIRSFSDPDDMSDLEKRRKKLIQKTLTDFGGEVRITFTLNGINHIIKRSTISNEIHLKIDAGDFQLVKEEDVRKILPIQAYSQKQLSSVGVSTDELKRFIQTPILTEIANLDFELAENVKLTRSEYLNVNRRRDIEKEIELIELETTSLSTQALALRQSLSGISEEDQALIAKKVVYEQEANVISNIKREFDTVFSKVNELTTALQNHPEPLPEGLSLPNIDLISILHDAKSRKLNEIKDLATALKDTLLSENNEEVRTKLAEWDTLKQEFDAQYNDAKSRSSSNQQQLDEIQRIENRLLQLSESVNVRLAGLRDIGDPAVAFENFRIQYWRLHNEKALILSEQATKFSDLSKGIIKIDVLKNIDIILIKSELSKALTGTRISGEKIQEICSAIGSGESPLEEWNLVLNELRNLAELKLAEGLSDYSLPHCPRLSEYGLNDNNLRRISEVLTADNWLNLATLKIEFTPDFKYTTNSEMEDVIPFSEASAGQQATALLTVLLNQPGTPLLIDQPEDDIDNRAIDDIIKNIWDAKKSRQLIFTSHNANLVVNGDAELVVCCDYREAGNQTRGTIKAEGAIDSKAVKDEITSVMEGGEKAFKLRKDKYGF